MDDFWHLRPVGHMKSVFHYKNGTPRQPSVCSHARGSITVDRGLFNNPEHSLEGLEHFSHVWIMFLFHKNNNVHTKAKVKPPRLNGKKVGVFSTRSPYRPNAIGLTLATIEYIQDATIFLKGIDILDGSPILDIKPYIPDYDDPGIPVQSVRSGDYGPSSPEKVSDDAEHDQYSSAGPGETTSDDSSFVPGSLRPDCHTAVSGNVAMQSPDCHTAVSRNVAMQSDCHTAVSGNVAMQSDCHTAVSGNVAMQSDCHKAVSGNVAMQSDCHTAVSGNVAMQSDVQTVVSGNDVSVASSSLQSDCQTYVSGSVAIQSDCPTDVSRNIAMHSDCRTDDSANIAMQSECKTDVSGNLASVAAQNRTTSGEVLSMSELDKSLPCDDEQREATLDGINFPHSDPKSSSTSITSESQVIPTSGNRKNVQTADWIKFSTVKKLDVRFTPTALEQLQNFSPASSDGKYKLGMFTSVTEVQCAIQEVLNEDPRSVYRRTKCKDSLYYFAIDTVHITCWFDDTMAEVVRIQPTALVAQCSRQTY